ncbi:hypothetical protein [Cellulomonas aerilata]|uniref:Uncharacterized protein n=1 Tax=Cellulomonas aerilata TaxID=515326 RepID=A0A512DCA6_9CELL|nr:hypothetical protein [Cellulomonas aerilata]GEO33860.1 hypothetical protein CAE01nite_15850 [Cellulomonas aerilata]
MKLGRLPAVAAAAAALTTIGIAAAGPAAADHTVDIDVDDGRCVKGPRSLGIPIRLDADRSTVRTLRDGTIVTRCHFRDLPEVVRHPDFPDPWIRPDRATRFSKPANCSLTGGGFSEVFGDAEVVVTPAGTLKVTCTFTPPFGPPA